jgi:ribonuclease Z
VVHECTNAYLPTLDESQVKEGVSRESVRELAKEHGHSTPEGAGGFARAVGAKRLVLNHLSNKYAATGPVVEGLDEGESGRRRRGMLREIERLAGVAWGSEVPVIAAEDFTEVVIERVDR